MDLPPVTLEQAQQLYERPAYMQTVDEPSSTSAARALMLEQNEAAQLRSQAMLDTALGVGVKMGIAWQLHQISLAVQDNERAFDTTYDFSNLMIQGRVVPPVITEARDLYNQDGDYALRLSGAYYKIEAQAKFSSVAPTWREYLSFPRPGRQNDYNMMKPKTAIEQKVWKLAVADGWAQGVEQANVMLEHSMDRLNRDLLGMLRFHQFVVQGKITMPVIASKSIPVTSDGNVMSVDETLLRITNLSEFDGDMDRWTGVARPAAPQAPDQKVWIKTSQPKPQRDAQQAAETGSSASTFSVKEQGATHE